MSKIIVPEDMLNSSIPALLRYEGEQNVIHGNPPTIGEERQCVREILESALLWLGKNPIVPSHDDLWRMGDEARECLDNGHWTHHVCVEWQRRMFLSPDPEYPSYERITKAMGAVTLSREEGDRIIEYVRGAIHDGYKS